MMTKEYILTKLKELKPKYEQDGLIILGLFGSYAKDNATENSDIDILYKLEIDKFLTKYDGFSGFSKLNSVRDELKDIFHKNIDLCTINQNNETFKKYALNETIYV